MFLVGCNQGWTASLQNLDHDYEAEFDALQHVGGNLVRITPFIGLPVDDEALLCERRNNLPWRREVGVYLLDLDAHGGNPLFWDRLADLVAYAHQRDIVISFELWDLYSAARGPGGNLGYRTPSGDRWSAHPYAPGNSRELVGEHALPAMTHMRDISFCKPVIEGGYQRALELQEQYVKWMLDALSPYPNVIYCMVNETSADKAWSDHWLEFTHRYFEENWGNAPHLAGEMPREFSFTENFTVEQMLADQRYGFADASQYFSGGGLAEMRRVKENGARFRTYRSEDPARLKPLTCMKIYNHGAPSVLWMRLLAGCATARYHRVVPGNVHPPIDAGPARQQLDHVRTVAGFLDETALQPWDMAPDGEAIGCHSGFDEVLAMSSEGRSILIALFFSEKDKVGNESVTVSLPHGTFEGFWLDPATGVEAPLATVGRGGEEAVSITPPDSLREVVLYLERR